MKRILSLSLFAALALAGTAAFAEDTCTKITATGHPQYPAIAYKDGDMIAGAAPMLVEAIAKNLKVPLESKYMGTWEEAQAAARDGKADMIFGIYYNDERAKYLDYVQPAFMYDEVVVFVAKDKSFTYKDENDLIGKKGVTNQGESYGNDFDAFIKDKLDVARANGIDAAFKELLAGNADYLIAGYYSGLAEAAKDGHQGQGRGAEPGNPRGRDVRRLLQEVALPLFGSRIQPGHYRDDDQRQFRHDVAGRDDGLGSAPSEELELRRVASLGHSSAAAAAGVRVLLAICLTERLSSFSCVCPFAPLVCTERPSK